MNPMFKAMQPKKKRPVDPNAPPRPNLMSHDKTIRDTKQTIEQQQQEILLLKRRLEDLESKFVRQTQYLQALHASLQSR